MSIEVRMPQLGESIVEGTITKWLKEEGETVEEFEPLLEINTDKVDTEIPSPGSGTVLKIYFGEDQTVQAGTIVAMLGEPGESVPDSTAIAPVKKAPPTEKPAEAAPSPVKITSASDRFISPVVARIAVEREIDLSQVSGTGREGRITKKDVLAFIEAEPHTAPWEEPGSGELFRPSEEVYGSKGLPPRSSSARAGSVLPITIIRKSIAEHMLRSRKTSPHVTTIMEADLSRVVAHRSEQKASFKRDGVKLTYLAYFVRAAVAGLKEWPIANSSWADDGIHLHSKVNIGFAVSMKEEGLIVPVIKDADQASLLGLARSIEDLASRARDHQLNPDEVQEGTFTITNHGGSGSLFATPIINQPQAAILGIGKVQKRVVVLEAGPDAGNRTDAGHHSDAIAIRPMVYLTLTFDHRILDGAIADYFLNTVVSRLENWG
ncbi:MAG: 2-oxo acid dehydrogenase subunit E2 [Chloroflexi bacterium]|nr:2-oxo acid dehydrogenase subunit E2 [Chloroflexota bacterium]